MFSDNPFAWQNYPNIDFCLPSSLLHSPQRNIYIPTEIGMIVK
jgi:hypothetical protein